MALNPELTEARFPAVLEGEQQVASRPGVSCAIQVEGLPTLSASGALFLSTLRLIFVADKPKTLSCGTRFESFSLPLAGLQQEKFHQPAFGCNYLAGTVAPQEASGILSDVRFKLYFKRGGAGTFLTLFFGALRQCRAWMSRQDETVRQARIPVAQVVEAAMDPQDPTSVYIVSKD